MLLMSDPYFGQKLTIREKFEKEAARINYETYAFWYRRLLEIAISGFEWENLPIEIEPRFLEWTLCFNGGALFFYDDEMQQFVVTEFAAGGPLDIYREPKRRKAYTANGQIYKTLTTKDSVICWNNYLHTGEMLALRLYAERLAELERAIDVNIKGQKTPKIIMCDKDAQLTMENLFKKYDGNIPFIFGNKGLQKISEINVLDVSTPFIANDLGVLKRQEYSEAMTYFGVENVNTEKKERLVSDEVTSNLGGVEIMRKARLNARERFCRLVNAKYGLNINVRFRAESATLEDTIRKVLMAT